MTYKQTTSQDIPKLHQLWQMKGVKILERQEPTNDLFGSPSFSIPGNSTSTCTLSHPPAVQNTNVWAWSSVTPRTEEEEIAQLKFAIQASATSECLQSENTMGI